MTPAARREMWLALADEAGLLVVDHEASLIIDADQAQPSIDMRLSALRGQTRGLSWNTLPLACWDAGKAFLWSASLFAAEDVSSAQRRERGAGLFEAARQLIDALNAAGPRYRADLDD